MLFSRQPVRSEWWHLHLWPWKGERDMAGTVHVRSLEELKRVVGVFLEAETRHCEIKINWQEMFAIQIPIPARRAEGTGKGECIESQMRSAAGICLLPLEGLPCDTFPKFLPDFSLESSVLCGCDYLLQREREGTLF